MRYLKYVILATILGGAVAATHSPTAADAKGHEHAYVNEDKTWFEPCCVEWQKTCSANEDRKACIETCAEYGERAVTRWTCECGAAKTSLGRCTRMP